MNTIFFTGNVGKDAELRTVNDTQVCNFNVAVKQGFGRHAPTEWYRVAVWGNRAVSLAEHVKKGAKVAVVGELEIGSYEGKPQFNVRAAEVDPFCGGKRDEGSGGPDTQERRPAGERHDLSDDIPFVTTEARGRVF